MTRLSYSDQVWGPHRPKEDRMEVAEIESTGVALVKRSREIVVRDAAGYEAAAAFLLVIRGYRDRVAETCDPVVQAALQAHRAAVAQRKTLDAPAEEAERIVKDTRRKWREIVERIAREEADRLQEEVRRRAEDEQLREAAAAEKAGDKATAQAILDAPTMVAPVIPASVVPKVAGFSVREDWKWRVVNPALIPREYLIVDSARVGGVVRSMKDQTRIPGIEAYPMSVESVRT